MLAALLSVAARAHADWRVELRSAPPPQLTGPSIEILAALEQSGRVICEWTWRAEASPSLRLTQTLDHAALQGAEPAAADLHLCINQDELRSFRPSVGDFHVRVSVDLTLPEAVLNLPQADWRQRRISRAENLLTVRYHRYDEDYDAVGLWTWGEPPCRTPAEQEVFPVGHDSFGVVFQLDLDDYACSAEAAPSGKLGLLPRRRRSWDYKDGPDRLWEASLGRSVYILPADARIHRDMPDVQPKLASASLHSDREIVASFTHLLPVDGLTAARFALFNEDGRETQLTDVQPKAGRDGKARTFALRAAAPLDITGHRYRLRAQDYGEVRVQFGAILADPARFYDPAQVIGATCTRQRAAFRVFAPTAREMHLVLADRPTGDAGLVEQSMSQAAQGIWALDLDGDHVGKFYSFRISGFGPSTELADPAAVCASGFAARPMLVDLVETNPAGFDASKHPRLAAYTDAIIYEMSVRDLTTYARSGVKHKGRFLGLTESGTHLDGDPAVKTGLDHLVELGVTHVQLMPIQDFENDETDRTAYNWGYMPVLFSTPEGWFATDPVGPARIRELKAAIHALHERGIAVTLDVVYNHTSAAAPLEQLVPGYYYRLTEDGALSNGSGCGNEFNSENPMARKLMIDSLLHWVREYGIDGFRFDLMGLHAPETMLAIRDALRAAHPEVLIYGEPWVAGATPLPQVCDKGQTRGTGIAAFNDHFRDAIKGDRDGGAPGFIQSGDRLEGVKKGVAGAIDDWALHPTDTIQYCEAHDNLTTWDKLLQSAGQQPEDARKRMQRLAGLIVLTSQGVPFIHAGQEFCRSKGGNSNSYNAPDEVNQIDWSLKQRHKDVFAYYRGLIAFRKSHPVLRLRTGEEVRARLAFLTALPHPRCIAYTLDGRGLAGESLIAVLVLLNGDSGEQTFTLPGGRWSVYADGDRAGTAPLREVEQRVTLPAHSGMVLGKRG